MTELFPDEDNLPLRPADRDFERLLIRLQRDPKLLSLSDATLRLTGRRHDMEQPVPVRAIVSRQVAYVEEVEVDAEAIASTPRAVLIRILHRDGRSPSHAWVWAGAVQRKKPRRD